MLAAISILAFIMVFSVRMFRIIILRFPRRLFPDFIHRVFRPWVS